MLSPGQFRAAARRVSLVAQAAPDDIVARGLNWYPAVHDATRSGARDLGISTERGAGIVAAVSPNMDWEKNNIAALSEIGNLTEEHWGIVHASHRQAQADRSAGRKYGRSDEARSMLTEVAPSIAAASDPALVRAHRFLSDPESSIARDLPAQTGPKTNRFARNILDPSDPLPVTVDGRHADIMENQMRGWAANRRISSADLKSGKRTRYESFEAATRSAAAALPGRDERFPAGVPASAVQAVVWEHGKAIELSAPTASGKPRKQAATRQGQPYLLPGGRLPYSDSP